MKFVLSSTVLSSRLSTIGRVIAPKNAIPILGCFLFKIEGNTLTVTASDNDATFNAIIPLNECDADVRFAINAKTIQDAIKEIPDQPIDCYFNTENNELTIDYQNGQYKLMGQSAEEYPEMVDGEDEKLRFTINSQQLLSGINRSLVAVAADNLRPQLNAICFDIYEQSVSMVTTNGNQLALTKMPMESVGEATCRYLLGARSAGLLKGMLSKEEGDTVIGLGSRISAFTTDNYTFTCRMVEGNFPNYRSIIPQNNPHVVVLNRQAFISALRRVLVIANNAQSILVKLRIDSNAIRLSSQDVEFGKSAEETLLCEYTGTPMQIAFKGNVLLDIINNIESEDVTIKLSDPSRAGLVTPTQKEESEEIIMLIMPSVFTD